MDKRFPNEYKTALFLDFDNVFVSIKNGRSEKSKEKADLFGYNPLGWLQWFEEGRHDLKNPNITRRILMRRCYLNPKFYHYRRSFTRAGFFTIDCPSLTSQGKNSADISIVVDIIDAMEHRAHFDEFLIMSADADFTPVLLRLREHDRGTCVLSTPVTSGALKNAATSVFQLDDFIEQAIIQEQRDHRGDRHRSRHQHRGNDDAPPRDPPPEYARKNDNLAPMAVVDNDDNDDRGLADFIREISVAIDWPRLSSRQLRHVLHRLHRGIAEGLRDDEEMRGYICATFEDGVENGSGDLDEAILPPAADFIITMLHRQYPGFYEAMWDWDYLCGRCHRALRSLLGYAMGLAWDGEKERMLGRYFSFIDIVGAIDIPQTLAKSDGISGAPAVIFGEARAETKIATIQKSSRPPSLYGSGS